MGRPRLDHIGILVADTEAALAHFSGHLGLALLGQEVLAAPHVRLSYLDAGSITVQLVEPLDGESDAARALAARGEGLHHLCFDADDVAGTARSLSHEPALEPRLVQGAGRLSAFVPGPQPHGVLLECTRVDRPSEADEAVLERSDAVDLDRDDVAGL